MAKPPDSWKHKLRCGCGMAPVLEISGEPCNPSECLAEAILAYKKPGGYLTITTENDDGQLQLRCFAKNPGKSVASIPADTVLRRGSPGRQISAEDHVKALLEWLHLRRNRTILNRDLECSEASDLESIEAQERVLSTIAEYQRLRFGLVPETARGNPDHLAILMIGQPFGLFELTGPELADCFDAICACKKAKPHDTDSLERLRNFVKTSL